VRPLASSGAKTTSQYSRDHEVQVISGAWTGLGYPVHSLIGGKWTSFRAFSEQAADKALEFLERPREKNTRELPIGGGRNYPQGAGEQKKLVEGIAAWTVLPAPRIQTLFERYGTRAELVAQFLAESPDAPLDSLPDYSRREIAYLAQNEKVIHLDDFVLRRSMLAMLGLLTSRSSLEELAAVLGESLGWEATQIKAEVARTAELLATRHGVRL